MSLDLLVPGQRDWVKATNTNLNNLNDEDLYLDDWHTDGVVFLNGWGLAMNDNLPYKLQWRVLKRNNGKILYTEVAGVLGSADRWNGQEVDFAKISGVPRPARPSAIGAIMASSVGNANTGFAYVSIDWRDNCLVLSAKGSRFGQGGDKLDGFRKFHLMY